MAMVVLIIDIIKALTVNVLDRNYQMAHSCTSSTQDHWTLRGAKVGQLVFVWGKPTSGLWNQGRLMGVSRSDGGEGFSWSVHWAQCSRISGGSCVRQPCVGQLIFVVYTVVQCVQC